MAEQNSEMSPAMQKAIELFRKGQSVQAEEIMVQAVRDAEKQFGPQHPQTAIAYNELGTILINVDNFPGAIDAYRRACAGPMPSDKQALRDRLTYLMNLGMALQYAGKLDEAEDVLRQGLQGRASYYGTDHPGYAFGLEPLANVLLLEGKTDEAIQLLEETIANFWRNGHPRVATALALRAEAFKRAGRREDPFHWCEQLPNEILQEILNHITSRAEHSDPGILSQVLQDYVGALRKRFGPDHPLIVNTLIWTVNLESMRGPQADNDLRARIAREVMDIHDRKGQAVEALQAAQGLALSLSDANRHDEAIAAYRDAVERARRIGDPARLSQVRRNFGLLLSEREQDAEAQAELQGAVEDAQRSKDHEMLSRAQIALGIFQQHRQRLDEARPLLTTALQNIDPAHSDAVIARSHLQALESGQTCGCDKQAEGIAAAFREFVLQRLPPDLLRQFGVRLENNDFKVEVHLNREPKEEEVEHLNRVITHALSEFRHKLRQRR